MYLKNILMFKEKKTKQNPIKTIATKADETWNLPCEDVPKCPDFYWECS